MDKHKRNANFPIILGVVTGVMLTLLTLKMGVLLMNQNGHVAPSWFYLILVSVIGSFFIFMLWLETVGVNIRIERDCNTIAERERQYALLCAKFLAHVDQTDKVLGQWTPKGTIQVDLIQRKIREGIKINWSWVEGTTIQPPSHQQLIQLVEGDTTLTECLDYQIKMAHAMREDVEVCTEGLFTQVEALWKLQPPQADVRDVRQTVSSLAWRLTQYVGNNLTNYSLRKVSPQALRWLVTNREPKHSRHVALLEHYVLHGTLDANSEPESEPESPTAA